jgi:hypothetical protein
MPPKRAIDATRRSDEEIWATVAFLKKLPGMTAEEYGKLIMATIGQGGHQHPGSGDPAAAPQAPPTNAHRH